MDEPTGKPLVLVVEEDSGVRRFLEVALAAHGFAVISAGSGEEGVVAYQNRASEVDLVLMDVQMPGIDGAAAFEHLQQIRPEVRCCFMTGDTSLSRRDELLAMGAYFVFSKPFASVQELVHKLREVLTSA